MLSCSPTGILDFACASEQLAAIVHATQFGHVPNAFGSAKIVARGRSLVVARASVAPAPHAGASGKVVAADANGIVVTCGTGALRIEAVEELDGTKIELEALGLRVGDRLDELDATLRAALEATEANRTKDESFWLQRLTRAPSVSLLSELERRLATGARERRTSAVRVDAGDLQAIARRIDVDPAAVLLAVFLGYTARTARAEEIAVAYRGPAIDRRSSERPRLGAPWVPLVIDVKDEETFGSFARRVFEEMTQLEARGDYRLDLVGRTPELRKEPVPRWKQTVGVVLGGAADGGTEGPPLLFRIDGGSASVAFDAAHFDASLAELFVERLGARLAVAMQRPDATLDDLPVLTEEERRKVLFEWNATEAPTPRGLIHEQFVARAARAPDAIALIETGRPPTTYGELDRRSTMLARWLRARGLRRGGHVGVWIERSSELVVAMLGILKAGGIYVPLERRWPGRRIASIANGLSMRWLVTKSANEAVVSELQPDVPSLRDVLYVDRDLVDASSDDERAPSADLSETDVAYIIFTSGSTGEPKGVVETHRAAVNLITWVNVTFGVGPEDRLLFVTSPCFDLSIYDVFGTLAAGGSIRIASEEEVAEPTTLLRMMRDDGITFWDSAPAVLLQLAAFFEKTDTALRIVFLSGDWVPVSLPDRVREAFPRARVIALGGATEATVWSNFFPVGEVDLSWRSIPYGRPITNAQYYVLDDELAPCPVGLAGDLYIGGECLSRGYTDPILTAGKFVPDPYRGVAGARLYRTGDRARFLADGNIEFLGRLDNQVKVRGYRIELGEIEAAMRAHPSVREAFGHVRERGSREDKELIAYVVPRSGERVDVEELRTLAKQRLPEYMVPSAFVVLDALPLTPNGKVDRKALPAPDVSAAASAYVAPRTEVEAKLAAVFAEVLRLPRVGIHENFYALGGDSIATMRVIAVARLRDVHLSIKDVFAAPTVAELAERAGTSTRALHAEQGLVGGPFTLSPIYRWFLDPAPADPDHFNQSLLLTLPKRASVGALRSVLAVLARHHDALRLRFREEDGRWQARFDGEPSRSFPLDVHDLTSHDASARARIIEERCAEAEASFDLADGPIARALLFELGDEPARLFLAIHHFAIDGVSWRILTDDLDTLLAGGTLPDKTTSFQAWTERLAAFAASDDAKTHLGFWLGQAQPWRHAAQLPPPTSSHGQARKVRVALDEEHTRALLTSALLPYRLRVDEAQLTAFARALARFDGAATHAVALESHGRDMPFDELDVSRTVGWFTAMFPVLVTARHDVPVADALVVVKEQVRSFVPHGASWFLLRYLGDDTLAKALPEPRILFNYLGQQMSGGFDAALEPSDTFAPDQRLSHTLIVDSIVTSGEWVATLTYDPAAISPEEAEQLGADFVDELRAIVVHAASKDAGALTPSDVSSVTIDQPTLDRVTAKATGRRSAAADVYALAPLQEGVLFHHLLAPGDDPYVIQGIYSLSPRVDVDALERAFQALVDRHDVLRTSFVWEGLPRPLQVVHQRARFVLERLDWTDVPASEVGTRLSAFIAENRRRGFDLRSCPLIRASVLRLADGSARLVWTKHHAIIDGWSLALLRRELFAAYAHFTMGTPLELPPPPRFRAFIDELAVRSADDARDDERFFRSLLKGVDEPTLLDPPPSADPTRWAEATRTLPAALFDAVATLARTLRVTISTVVHAAFAVVLARYTGRRDVLLGSITSGRSAPVRGIESIVGLFINAVPVRIRVADVRLSEWLVSLQETFNELRSHEHVPLTTVGDWSDIPKGQPLFEALLVIENYAAGEDAARDLGFLPSGFAERTHYPLNLNVLAPGNEIRFVLSYDAVRFADTAVPRALEHLETALRFIVESPSARAVDVPILGDAEKAELLVAWNDTRAEYAGDKYIHEVFEEQAARTPNAIAIEYEEERIRYAELNARANRLASWLRERGVGPESAVGVLMDRSVEMVTSLYAILKAGAAYVPLDPELPVARLETMIAQAGARCILGQPHTTGLLRESVVDVVSLMRELADRPAENHPSGAHGAGQAYIIFTSGSTGTPKGVVNTHDGIRNRLLWMQQAFRLTSGDCVLQKTPFTFDVSVWEFFWPLMVGARLAIARPGEHRDPHALVRTIRKHGVTTLHFVPSMLGAFLEHDEVSSCQSVRRVFCSGEALTREQCRRFREQLGAELHNLYGPTEAAVDVTWWDCSKGPIPERVPIGRPIANTRVFVLDASMNPVPVGVTGELHLGGVQLARGYVGRPDLTADRFVPSPFAEGERLYKTGDLARFRVDGALEYLGRIDHQVKLRGFRIELGEIEAALTSREDVSAAVVVAREDTPGDKRLVGYVVAVGGTSVDVPTMKTGLEALLPEYMVPSAFVVLDALPLTPSGKVHRKALPAPDLSAAAAGYVAPRSPLEETLAQIWREVLGLERAGIHDNFFELGGHSLSAMQVISRANAALHRELAVAVVLEHPTIAELAAALDTAMLEEGEI